MNNGTPNSPSSVNNAAESVGPPSKLDWKCPHHQTISNRLLYFSRLGLTGARLASTNARPSSRDPQIGGSSDSEPLYPHTACIKRLDPTASPTSRTVDGRSPRSSLSSEGVRFTPLILSSTVYSCVINQDLSAAYSSQGTNTTGLVDITYMM